MNNDKGEMTQNDERPLSNKEVRELLRLTICLEHGPIEKGDHAEVHRRQRLLRTVPTQMKHHFKGYKPKALENKANIATVIGEWLNDENWLTTARNDPNAQVARSVAIRSPHIYYTVTHGVADQWHLEEMDRTCDSVPEGEEGEWALWETSMNEVIQTIRLVTEPSFAAKYFAPEQTEEVAA